MLKTIAVFFVLGYLLNIGVFAADPASARISALKQYIAAMKIADPSRRVPALLMVLEKDPGDRAACQSLLIMRRQYPKLAPVITAGLLRVAERNPEVPELNLAAFFAAMGGTPADIGKAVDNAGNVIRNLSQPEKLSSESRTAYLELLVIYVNDLQKKGRFTEADGLLSSIRSRMPETADGVLLAMQGQIRARAIFQSSDERRCWGLRQSERAEWQEKLQESLTGLRRTDAMLLNLADFERRVNLYIKLRSFDDALKTSELAADKLPGNPGAEYLRITTRMRTRHYPEAYSVAGELARRMPEDPAALRLLADTAMRCGEYRAAEEAGKRLEAVQQPDESGCFFTVTALVLQKKYKEAETRISKIRDPRLRMALDLMCKNRTRSSYDPLLKRLRKLEANPKYKGGDAVYTQMLSIAERTHDAALLNYCWKKLSAMGALKEPENANNVGYTAATMGIRLDEARGLLETALAAQPENGAYLDSMAWVCYRQGRYQEAWKYIRQALALPDDDFTLGVVLDHAGDIAVKIGKPETALDYYRQALGDYLTMELDQTAVKAKIKALEKELKEKTRK